MAQINVLLKNPKERKSRTEFDAKYLFHLFLTLVFVKDLFIFILCVCVYILAYIQMHYKHGTPLEARRHCIPGTEVTGCCELLRGC